MENVKQQIDNYQISFDSQKSNFYNYYPVKRLAFKELQYLSKLNSSDLYEIFAKNDKIESYTFFDIFLSVNFIQDIIKSVSKSNIDNQRKYFKFVQHIEKDLHSISTILYSRRYILTNSETKDSETELSYVKRIIAIIEDININDFKSLNDKLVPLILSDTTVEYLEQRISEKIINKAKNIAYNTSKIKVNNEKSNENLNTFMQKLINETEILERTTNIISTI